MHIPAIQINTANNWRYFKLFQVPVPREIVGFVIGKGGETIKRIQAETGCKVQFTMRKLTSMQFISTWKNVVTVKEQLSHRSSLFCLETHLKNWFHSMFLVVSKWSYECKPIYIKSIYIWCKSMWWYIWSTICILQRNRIGRTFFLVKKRQVESLLFVYGIIANFKAVTILFRPHPLVQSSVSY